MKQVSLLSPFVRGINGEGRVLGREISDVLTYPMEAIDFGTKLPGSKSLFKEYHSQIFSFNTHQLSRLTNFFVLRCKTIIGAISQSSFPEKAIKKVGQRSAELFQLNCLPVFLE